MSLIVPMGVSTGSGVVEGLGMWCPGCEDLHSVHLGDPRSAVGTGWTFTGDASAPTFSPSILVQYGNQPGAKRCHSFIRIGRWEFLSDSTHALAGQTVPMVNVPDWVQ